MLIQELFTMQILETSEMAQKSDWYKYTNIAWPKMELIWLWKVLFGKSFKDMWKYFLA